MRSVPVAAEVIQRVVEDALRLLFDDQRRQRARLSRELLFHLFDMVVVDVHVPAVPSECPHLQASLLSSHVRQQCVAGDVERYSEEHVAAALSDDGRQYALDHVELEHVVAWFQRHLRQFVGPPGGHDNPTRVGVVDQ